jgi:hypothetical protein
MRSPFISKECPVCKVEKLRSEYYKKGETVSHKCKPCTLIDLKSRQSKYFSKYSERQNNWRRERYKNDAEYRADIANKKKVFYDINKDSLNAKRRERWDKDPLCPAKKYYRRKDVKDKTPKWVDLNDILKVYAGCPKGYHVDHIIPLRGLIDGRPVTGLHVAYNLQYLTASENLKKKHRISEAYLELCGNNSA